MEKVTDPELLERLNYKPGLADENKKQGTLEKVTDPELLKKLNAGSSANLGGIGASLEKGARDLRGMVGDAAEYIEKSFTGCLLRLVNLHKNVIDKEVLKIIYNSVPECCDD